MAGAAPPHPLHGTALLWSNRGEVWGALSLASSVIPPDIPDAGDIGLSTEHQCIPR
jgi:hypothetical protein